MSMIDLKTGIASPKSLFGTPKILSYIK
uniref:Uncharacterized protein n=1 Tax=Lepeophtheirus salmonis TaxID=72036 RepID=A0A0K2SXP3_LEPSM